ncbi:hypothetical protein PPROV_000871300 [Pycnococcus provasolii]|uniref:Uncharacterized protein n=1 Tax=Pycnococcus provasolii TaxID=41880 RepID=A0A830HW31_9CHLO|nr:hypothetical protein PPROV_000871300 [Pycnococcus provasolii]
MHTSAMNEPTMLFEVMPLSKTSIPMMMMLIVLKRASTAYVTGPNVPLMDTELQLTQKERQTDVISSV